MTSEISIYQAFPTEGELKNLQMIAHAAYKSGLYKGNADGIVMTLLSARELNIGPMMALNGGIHNINGKTELSSRLMATLIRRAGHSITIKGDDKICTISGKRKDTGDIAECTFTMENAEKAGLLSNPSWKKYPEDMLFARALSRLSRRLFPDVIGNCYVEGEIDTKREVNPDPTKLPEADAEVVEPPQELEPPPEIVKTVSEDQAKELNKLRSSLSEEGQTMIDKYVHGSLKADSMDKLPEIHYETIMSAMARRFTSENTQPQA